MSGFTSWLWALPVLLALALPAWALCTARRNAGLVDIFWSAFFLAACVPYALAAETLSGTALAVLAVVAVWALRLSGHLALRNWNAPEDPRYRAIRARNEPGFWWKSLYLVFGFQAVLAWLVSAPLAGAIASGQPLGAIAWLGVALALFGLVWESVADAQLTRFRSDPSNARRVMDSGLWRYSRHPNYFGEFCVWWGLYVIAAGAGAAWTVFAPIVMSVLLLRVSGVPLLEKDIGERRPGYHDYAARTNTFFPGPPRDTPCTQN